MGRVILLHNIPAKALVLSIRLIKVVSYCRQSCALNVAILLEQADLFGQMDRNRAFDQLIADMMDAVDYLSRK